MSAPTPPADDPRLAGPLDRRSAFALLQTAEAAAGEGDFTQAASAYSRLVGTGDPEIHVAALLGLADAHYRLDHDDAALATWEAATRAPETGLAWRAWKQLAAARVRADDIPGAIAAYRQAERRSPPEERAEIASRLGWLNKESGNERAAGRYFRTARTGVPTPIATYAILAVTIGIGLAQLLNPGQDIYAAALGLVKADVAAGQWWRLVSVVLVHAGLLHLGFNMYFLYLIGPIIEGLYGTSRFVLLYVLTAAAASTLSFIFEPADAVGASGALFGLAGVLAVTMRIYKPLLGRQARALAGQIVFLIVINLVFDLGVVGGGLLNIDIFAHVGGLIAGAWLGLVIPPLAPTIRSAFIRPGLPGRPNLGGLAVQAVGVAVVVAAIAAGVALGTPLRERPGLSLVPPAAPATEQTPRADPPPAGPAALRIGR